MAKYDSQLAELKTQLIAGKKVLIACPAQISVDKLASSLALMLSLKNGGFSAEVVTEGVPLVSHSNLYGIGDVKNSIASQTAGNFTITLENVVEGNGQISSLEKLDWYPEGSNLNLVFHVLPGKTFQPTNIAQKFSSSNYDFIFVLGASNLNELGGIYSQNVTQFSTTPVLNIDINPTNSNFGKVNIVETNASSLSEIMVEVISSLGLTLDPDTASNIVAGIYDATTNLTSNVKSETFIALGQAMQAGGKVPQPQTQSQPTPAFLQPQPAAPNPQPFPPSAPVAQPTPAIQPEEPAQTPQAPSIQTAFPDQAYDLAKVFGAPIPAQSQDTFITPQVAPVEQNQPEEKKEEPKEESPEVGTNQKSLEERPTGEFAISSSPEAETNPAPDWLTPKIFKGGSLG